MTPDVVVSTLRSDAVAVCAGLVGPDASVVAWDGPEAPREPLGRLVAAQAGLPWVASLGSPARRWLVETASGALVAQVVDGVGTLFVVLDARSTPGLARVRLLQAAGRLVPPEKP
ncbi:MAG: hypothetical protein RL199_2465 [Pseudomonadota bacterium]|jgi:hypothetical protein